MAKVLAVCTSDRRGIQKINVHTAHFVEDWGLEGDAHAGKWHRQVSLLSKEKIDAFRARGAEVVDGDFGENLVVEGIDFRTLPLGTKFTCGEVVLELTQIGKECHNGCAIFQKMGECIMPTEGVFARVLHGGDISEGDEMTWELPFRTAVITVSDTASAGQKQDRSGPVLAAYLRERHYPVVLTKILPDGIEPLAAELRTICDDGTADLIFTTGGTGFSQRDLTPEATRAVIERETPGIPEAMRAASMQITPRGMLSRSAAGIRKGTLIVNLPGSPKAVRENLEVILPALPHGLEILKGTATNCAQTETDNHK